MKIKQVLILPIFLLMFILSSCILSSSNTKFYHYDYFEGIYYCDSIDSELYSKGKVEIKEINKNTFIRNNGKNCVEDKKNIDNYYLFELYLFNVETHTYELFNIYNLEAEGHTPERYVGDLIIDSNLIKKVDINNYSYNIYINCQDFISGDFKKHLDYGYYKVIDSIKLENNIPSFATDIVNEENSRKYSLVFTYIDLIDIYPQFNEYNIDNKIFNDRFLIVIVRNDNKVHQNIIYYNFNVNDSTISLSEREILGHNYNGIYMDVIAIHHNLLPQNFNKNAIYEWDCKTIYEQEYLNDIVKNELKSFTYSTNLPLFDTENKGNHVPNNLFMLSNVPNELESSINIYKNDKFYFISDRNSFNSLMDKVNANVDIAVDFNLYNIMIILREEYDTTENVAVKYSDLIFEDNIISLTRSYNDIIDVMHKTDKTICIDILLVDKSFSFSNNTKYEFIINEMK